MAPCAVEIRDNQAQIRALWAHLRHQDERMDSLEDIFVDSVDKHEKDLKSPTDSHEKHTKEMAGVAEAHAIHVSRQDRVNFLRELVDQHDRELQTLLDTHSKYTQELAGVETLRTHHTILEDRFESLQKLLNDLTDKHDAELEALKPHPCTGCGR